MRSRKGPQAWTPPVGGKSRELARHRGATKIVYWEWEEPKTREQAAEWLVKNWTKIEKEHGEDTLSKIVIQMESKMW